MAVVEVVAATAAEGVVAERRKRNATNLSDCMTKNNTILRVDIHINGFLLHLWICE